MVVWVLKAHEATPETQETSAQPAQLDAMGPKVFAEIPAQLAIQAQQAEQVKRAKLDTSVISESQVWKVPLAKPDRQDLAV
jgi:hypothetical protein